MRTHLIERDRLSLSMCTFGSARPTDSLRRRYQGSALINRARKPSVSSAQRFFIASESRLRPAAVRPPRFLGFVVVPDTSPPAVLAAALLLCAQRLFIASDSLRRPAGVRPPPRRGRRLPPAEAGGRPTRFFEGVFPSSRPTTWLIRSSSLFSSATIISMSKNPSALSTSNLTHRPSDRLVLQYGGLLLCGDRARPRQY